MAQELLDHIIDLSNRFARLETRYEESRDARLAMTESVKTLVTEGRENRHAQNATAQTVASLVILTEKHDARLKRIESAPWRFVRRSAVAIGALGAATWAGVGEPILKVFVEHRWFAH